MQQEASSRAQDPSAVMEVEGRPGPPLLSIVRVAAKPAHPGISSSTVGGAERDREAGGLRHQLPPPDLQVTLVLVGRWHCGLISLR